MALLADSVSHSRSRVTHTVARLEKAGLVRRAACESDGRGVEASITDKGMAQLKRAMPQIDPDELRGKLQAEKVITLFTVENLADMVAERAEAGAG